MKHKQMPTDGRQDHALPSESPSFPAQPAAAISFMSSMVSGVFVTQMGNSSGRAISARSRACNCARAALLQS